MPQAIPAAAAAITSAVAAIKGSALAIGAIKLAATVALSAASSLLMAPKVDAAGSPTDWTSDPNAPVSALFGEMELGGQIVARKAFGDEHMYQAVVSVISCAGPIAGIDAVLVEKEVVGINPTTQQADPPYGDKLWFSYQLGAQPEPTALQSPAGLRGGVSMDGWTAAHKLSGKPAYMATFGHDSKQKIWKRGNLPEFAVRARGQLIYDARKDSTYPGGVGAHRLTNAATWEYSANGPLCALKWALGLWESATGKGVPGIGQQVLGLGLDPEEIDTASFVEGANLADALGWVLSARPTEDDDPWEVLKAMLQAGGCAPIHVDGVLTCIPIAAAKSSVVTLETEDILGPIQYARTPSRLDRKNSVFPRFRSPAHNYDMVTADIVERDIYLAEDGGRRRSREVELPYVPDVEQAATLAAYWVADSREGFIGGVQVNPHLRGVKPGRCFTMPTDPSWGEISGKKLYLVERKFDTKAHVLTWSFREETDSKHAWAGGIVGTVVDPVDPDTPPVDLAAPDAEDWTLTGGTLGAGAGLPALFVDGVCTNPLAGGVVLEYRVDGTSEWSLWAEGDPNDEHYETTNVAPATAYEVSLRFRDERTGIISQNRLLLGPETTGPVVVSWDDQDTPDPSTLDGWDIARRTGGGVLDALADLDGAAASKLGGIEAGATQSRTFTGSTPGAGPFTVNDVWRDTSGSVVVLRIRNATNTAWVSAATNVDNTNQLTDGAGLGQTSTWMGTAGRPPNLSALSGSEVLDNATLQAALESGSVIPAEADSLTGEGPLAKSALSEAQVQGRARGYYAGGVAAYEADDPLDGDTWVDGGVFPPRGMMRVGGVNLPIQPTGIQTGVNTNFDIAGTGATMTTLWSFTLPYPVLVTSFFAVQMGLEVQTSPARTRSSSSSQAPGGPWEVWECPPGGDHTSQGARIILSGTFTSDIAGGGLNADHITDFNNASLGDGWSKLGDQYRFKFGGAETFVVRGHQNGGPNLLDARAELAVFVQRND